MKPRIVASLAAGLLALSATVVMAQSPSPMPAPESGAPPSTMPSAPIAVTLADFTIDPVSIQATALDLTFAVVNNGPTPHNMTIRDDAGTVLGATSDLSTGGTETLTVSLPGPGTYVTFCSLPGHESLGLVGDLVVTGPVASPVSSAPMVPPAGSPLVSPAI